MGYLIREQVAGVGVGSVRRLLVLAGPWVRGYESVQTALLVSFVVEGEGKLGIWECGNRGCDSSGRRT